MTEIIGLITSSYVAQFVFWLIGPVWKDPLGRTALLTVLAYSVGYSLYSGYLSRFAGGFGSLSLSRLGIELSDLITLLPTALLTAIKIMRKGFRAFFGLVLQVFLLYFLPFLLGILLGVSAKAIKNWPFGTENDFLLQLGFLIYSLSSWLAVFSMGNRNRKWQIFFGVMQFAGIILMVLGLPFVASGQTPSSDQTQLIQHIWFYPIFQVLYVLGREVSIGMWFILLIFLIPIMFGSEIARIAIAEKALSQVTCLVLKQPVPHLKSFEQQMPFEREKPATLKEFWFARKSLPFEIVPDIYTYVIPEEMPLYLLDTFHNATAFYFPSSKDGLDKGRLFVIARETIAAITLERPGPVDEKSQA